MSAKERSHRNLRLAIRKWFNANPGWKTANVKAQTIAAIMVNDEDSHIYWRLNDPNSIYSGLTLNYRKTLITQLIMSWRTAQGRRLQCKDIKDKPILEHMSKYQGKWMCLWNGTDGVIPSVRDAFPPDIPDRLVLAKMKRLHDRGLVGGCACGCRGDFEITDKGLALIGAVRTAPYNGY